LQFWHRFSENNYITATVAIAYQEWENRKRLDAIDKALEQVEAALIGVMPEKNTKA